MSSPAAGAHPGEPAATDDPEARIAAAMASGDPALAVTNVLRAYGAEVFGWLVAVHGPVDAADVYGQLSLRLVRAMAGFRGESSARTWLYQIARNEARQHMRDARRRRAFLTPLEDHPSAGEGAPLTARTESRHGRLAELRARLSEEDRSLLVLRVDRGLAYRDIARVLNPDVEVPALEREAARLRQRLCDLRDRLRRWALEEV